MADEKIKVWGPTVQKPTLSQLIDPVLTKHGFKALNKQEVERTGSVETAAYTAAIMAIAEKQAYYGDSAESLDYILVDHSTVGAKEAAFNVLAHKDKLLPGDAIQKADAFRNDLEFACNQLADIYKPLQLG